MASLLETVTRHLDQDDWTYEVIPDTTIVRCGAQGKNASYRILFHVREEQLQAMVYVMLPNNVPEAQRTAAAEFITRANYGLRIGNFEMDFSDGELRYKVSVDVEGGELTERMVELMLSASISTADRYYPGLMAMLFGGVSAADAVQQVEEGSTSSAPGTVN